MASRTRFDLVDRILGGRLLDTLAAWKSDLTLDEMAVRFRQEHDIIVTRETLRRWCIENGIETDPRRTTGDAA